MLFRLVVLIISTLFAFFIGWNENKTLLHINTYISYPIIILIIAAFIIWLEITSHKAKGRRILFSSIGLLIGLVIGDFLGELFINAIPSLAKELKIVFSFLVAYVGFTLGWLKEPEMQFNYRAASKRNSGETVKHKILDTSVIIDGRIFDISETGFLEGVLIVPKFVLNELHQVADSSDPLKRNRGRRGLDILNKLKASKKTIIRITEEDFMDTPEVDSKLLKLAIQYGNATIVTNDFNLNKVAEFQDVQILNINELTNAVKPVLLPNEEIRIVVIKEGKDHNQGISYLDDGTMIVIDNGRNYIGKEVTVVVTSILQTPAGRMIFTQLTQTK